MKSKVLLKNHRTTVFLLCLALVVGIGISLNYRIQAKTEFKLPQLHK